MRGQDIHPGGMVEIAALPAGRAWTSASLIVNRSLSGSGSMSLLSESAGRLLRLPRASPLPNGPANAQPAWRTRSEAIPRGEEPHAWSTFA